MLDKGALSAIVSYSSVMRFTPSSVDGRENIQGKGGIDDDRR